MSLESKIDALTIAINALNITLTSTQLPLPLTTVDVKAVEVVEEPKEKQVTEKELKSKCLEVAKKLEDGKNKVKAVLKEHGASKVSEISEELRQDVIAQLEALS